MSASTLTSDDDSSISTAMFLNRGAIIQAFRINGHNLVLNFPDEEAYAKYNHPFLGETIGRVANRIPNAKIENVNGKPLHLIANDGKNTLHGGPEGFGKKRFQGPETVERQGRKALQYTLISEDGDQGFPGVLELRVWYFVSKEPDAQGKTTGKSVLEIEYEAELVGEEEGIWETPVSITNHSYFNISGGPTVKGTVVDFATTLHQPVDDQNIPLGTSITPFPGIQPNEPVTFDDNWPKIDHCFVLPPRGESNEVAREGESRFTTNIPPLDSRNLPFRRMISMSHPNTGINLTIESTESALQIYTGDMMQTPAVGDTPARGARAGIAIEPSRYINAANVEPWRSMVMLRRGELWGSRIRYTAEQR